VWKKVISLFLIVCLLSTLVGCGGGNPVVPPVNEESDEDIIFIQNTNPEDNVLAVAGKDEGEAAAILGEKDAFGNPIKITGAIYTSEQGDTFIIDAGDDGLPTYILDSTGNKVVFTNYTDSTVEISIYNSNNELIEGPTTITVNPDDLVILKQLYSSVNSKNKDAAEVVAFVLKWGGFGLTWAACALSIYSLVVPAIFKACGSAVLSTIAIFSPNDVDNLILSNLGVYQCALAFMPWEILACAGSIMSFISQIIEIINQEGEVPDVSGNWSGNYSSNLISCYIDFVNLTQSDTSFTGTYNDSCGTTGIISGEYDGNAFNFTMTQTNYDCSGSFSGTAYLDGNTLTFTFTGYNCLGTHENGVGSVTR